MCKAYSHSLPLCAVLFLGLIAAPARAQITPDATLPNNSVVLPNGNLLTIEGGTETGSNLFHSFQDFSIPTGNEAFFNNALTIDNIITRVTGGNLSDIDGLIRANGTANLFLINPNGIQFGPNASLEIGGSFLGSTADSVLFEDGSFFSATEANASPLLSVNVPIGLQMGASPGPITVRGLGHQVSIDETTFEFVKIDRPVGLQVPTGQTLALVGGDILLDGGNLTAWDGRIETWSVRNTEVSLDTSSALILNHLGASGVDGGTITLQQSSSIDTSGDRGGAIQVRGRGLTLQDGSYIFSDISGSGKGQTISVETTEFVDLLGVSAEGQLVTPGIGTFSLGGSDSISGDVVIETGRLRLANGDTISALPFRDGSSSGDIIIQAVDVTVEGGLPFAPFFSSFIANLVVNPSGNSGDIIIDAERVRVLDGGRIGAGILIESGNAGDVVVRASQSIELRGTRRDGLTSIIASDVSGVSEGRGGNIVIETPTVVLAEGGQISVGVAGSGDAGNINIQAAEIFVSDPVLDASGEGGVISGIAATVKEGGTGNGGDINLEADRLRVFDGGQITSANDGEGTAGNITVQVRELEVEGSGALVVNEFDRFTPQSENGRFTPSAIAVSAASEGAAGSVNITADTLRVIDSANILVSNTGSGNAGNLNATASNILLDNGGSLRAEVNGGTQGNINLNVRETFVLRRGSSIVANATGDATGGNININTENLVALENSDISANADLSFGGQVNIEADGIFGTQFRDAPTSESDITATSALGAEFSGVVQIQTPDVDAASGLVALDGDTLDPDTQVSDSCAAAVKNRFVLAGSGGFPEDPTQYLRGQTVWRDTRLGEIDSHLIPNATETELEETSTPIAPLVEATGWITNDEGQIELIVASGNPSHSSWQPHPECDAVSQESAAMP